MTDDIDRYDLKGIRSALEKCWAFDTSFHGRDEYEAKAREGVKSFGQCYVTAKVMNEVHGWRVVQNRHAKHYWNRLSDGTEIDFTSDQFDGDGVHPVMDENSRREDFEKYIGKTENRDGGNVRFGKLLKRFRDMPSM